MHVISSGAKVILIKIAQRFPDRKRKNGSAVKTAFRAALLCVILACFLPVSNAIHREAANDWRNGWEEWKCGNAAAALGHWSKNPLTAPFEMRPSRVAYWKIRAFEKLGRTEEAALTASMLALRCPRDFYSLVLAYEGRYPTLTRAARKACARGLYAALERRGRQGLGGDGRLKKHFAGTDKAGEQIQRAGGKPFRGRRPYAADAIHRARGGGPPEKRRIIAIRADA